MSSYNDNCFHIKLCCVEVLCIIISEQRCKIYSLALRYFNTAAGQSAAAGGDCRGGDRGGGRGGGSGAGGDSEIRVDNC